MRHLLLHLLAVALSSPFALAAQDTEPIRLCVAVLENRSHQAVSPEWQQKELIRALERTNKKKEVTKGTAARITLLCSNPPAVPIPRCKGKAAASSFIPSWSTYSRSAQPGLAPHHQVPSAPA